MQILSDSPLQLRKFLSLELYPNYVLKFFTKYTERHPFEQAVVDLLQELHDVYKRIRRAQFRVSTFNFKKNVHTGHIKNGYNIKVRISAFSFVVVAFYLKFFFSSFRYKLHSASRFRVSKMYFNFYMCEIKVSSEIWWAV